MNSTHAYVLVQSQSRSDGIARDLRGLAGIVLAEDLRGPYDAIALARPDSSGLTLEGIVAQIRALPEVTRAVWAPLRSSIRELREGEAA